MAQPPLFLEEELTWWEGPGPVPVAAAPTPAAPAVAAPWRRPETRTLAADLARLRAAIRRLHQARLGRAPPALLGLLGLALAAGLAIGLYVVVAGGANVEALTAASAPSVSEVGPAAVGKPATTPAKILGPGKRGRAVRDLQVALSILGYFGEAADGLYGPATSAAVATFQGSRALAADGVVGPLTRQALLDAIAAGAAEDVAVIQRRVAEAAGTGRLDEPTSARVATALANALEASGRLAPGRAALLALMLDDAASYPRAYDAVHATALAALVEENLAGLGSGRLQIRGNDIYDGTGIVYRHFPDQGYQFHPLASFARLNVLARRSQRDDVARLAAALVARGIRQGNMLLWEYRFPFGGPPVWTSGFAQAAGAQALARAGDLLGDASLLAGAGRAFAAIPQRLSRPLGGGTWVLEYGFTDRAILNAQLQSILSLEEYAQIVGDQRARAFVEELSDAARNLIDEFDTGCWSRYALEGQPASSHYHDYHVRLLQTLAERTGDPVWAQTAARWADYQRHGPC